MAIKLTCNNSHQPMQARNLHMGQFFVLYTDTNMLFVRLDAWVQIPSSEIPVLKIIDNDHWCETDTISADLMVLPVDNVQISYAT